MAIKNFYRNKIVTAGDMSADITSMTVDISRLDNVAIQLNWSAATDPVGSFELLQSVDNINFVAGVSSIDSLNLTATGSTGSKLYSASGVCAPYIQVMYDRTSGDGALDIWVSGKEI